jgi:hypothetical protein
MGRARLAALVTVVLLALPAAAAAQSAGDNQYVDPFAAPQQQSQPRQQRRHRQQGSRPAPATGTSQPAQAARAPSASPPAGAPSGDGGALLPRTGLPATLMPLLGAAMVAGGLALRKATARRARRRGPRYLV